MATAAEITEKKKYVVTIYDCPICLEKFRNPKQLPCLHTFCEYCLQTYVESTVKYVDNNSSFSCPVCRLPVSVPSSKSNTDNLAAEFSLNQAMQSLISGRLSKSGMSEQNCDPCKRIGNDVKATCWCQECNELLCKYCLESFHKRLKDAERHKVTNISDNQRMTRMAVCNVDEPCMEHKEKMYEVFCLDHSKLCCVICLAVHHHNCENVQTIDDIVNKIGPSKIELTALYDLSFLDKEIQMLISNKKAQIYTMTEQRDRRIAEAECKIDAVINKLNKMKIELKEEVTNTCLLETKPFEKQVEAFSLFHENILQNIQFLTTVRDLGNSKLVFFTLQKIMKSLLLHGEHFEKIASEIKTVFVDVVLDQALAESFCIFRVTKNHRMGWNGTSKLNIQKRLEKLNEGFNAMIHSSPAHTKSSNKIQSLTTGCKEDIMTEGFSHFDNHIISQEVAENVEPHSDISEEDESSVQQEEIEYWHARYVQTNTKGKKSNKKQRRERQDAFRSKPHIKRNLENKISW